MDAAKEYIELLRKLHEFECRGEEQSKEADAILEAMDAPWYEMTAEEQLRAQQLSEELYEISEPIRAERGLPRR